MRRCSPTQSGTGVRVDTRRRAHRGGARRGPAARWSPSWRTCSTTPRDAALATHRPVLPTVMDTVAEATRRWTHGVLPGSDPYLRTGEVLVAHVAGAGHKARVVAVEHHRPVRRPAAV